MAPTLISVQDKHPQKEGWKQTEAREGTLEAQVLEGYSIICLFFPWEPCAYMFAVQSEKLSAFLTEDPLFQTARLKRQSDKITLRAGLPAGAGADAIP